MDIMQKSLNTQIGQRDPDFEYFNNLTLKSNFKAMVIMSLDSKLNL